MDGQLMAARPPVAWRALGAISAVVAAALVAVSGRYGYHRDELYFLQAGQHLAFGYPDQPPLTPLPARVATELFGDSLVGLRPASALAAGLVVLVCGLIARELGGGRGPQVLAAGCIAVSAFVLAVGHLLSTSTFDLLDWTVSSWLVVRALRDGGRAWLAVGSVAGIGLQNKTLVAFLLAGLAVGVLVAGPRAALRSPWLWAAVGIALLLWTPNLVWQAVILMPQAGEPRSPGRRVQRQIELIRIARPRRRLAHTSWPRTHAATCVRGRKVCAGSPGGQGDGVAA